MYYPVNAIVQPVSPPVVFVVSPVPDTSTLLGPNQTSANVSVVASSRADVLLNPDFYSDADYWYCYNNTPDLSCYWLSSDTRASGGVVSIYGNIPANSFGLYAEILQSFIAPNSPVVSVNTTIRYRLADRPLLSSIYGFVGVYDVHQAQTVWYSNWSAQIGTYRNVSLNVDPTIFQPGKTYIFYTGVYVDYSLFLSGTLDYRIDYAQLTIVTTDRTYSNVALRVNVTDATTYYARLKLDNYDIQGSPDINVTLENSTTSSTPIRIENGAPISLQTSWIRITAPTNPLYTSGKVRVSASKTTGNTTLNLTLEYCSQPSSGVCVYYPVNLIVDPPQQASGGLSRGPAGLQEDALHGVEISPWTGIPPKPALPTDNSTPSG